MRREHPNLRAALQHCLTAAGEQRTRPGLRLAGTLWFYWTGCGFLREGRRWLDRFLALDATPSPERTKALWAAGAVAVAQGDADGAANMLRECAEQAARDGDERMLGFAGLSMAMVTLFADDYRRTRDLLEEALARFDHLREVNSATLLGRSTLALVVAVQGDLDQADKMCQQTLAVCRDRGDRWTTAWVAYVRAMTALGRGRLDEAVGHARDGMGLHHIFHNLTGIAMLAELYATLMVASGRAEDAAVVHGVAAQIWQIMGRRLFGSTALDEQHRRCEAQARQTLGDRGYEAALRHGARLSLPDAIGYVVADPSGDRLPPAEAGGVRADAGRARPAPSEPLTPRESEVAALIGRGLSNREIATRLVMSRRTAESHVESILRKLGFTSRAQIAAWHAGQHDP
jgi:non-specific serine/threonine protein kinase